MPLDTITRMCPSAPALAWRDMTGLGVVTSCRVPVRVALSAPVAWISTSALNDLICWVCCAASDSAEDDIPLWEPEPLGELVYTPGLHPATVMAAAAATATKPSGRTARAGTPKRAGRAGRSWVVPGWGASGRRAFNCENTWVLLGLAIALLDEQFVQSPATRRGLYGAHSPFTWPAQTA